MITPTIIFLIIAVIVSAVLAITFCNLRIGTPYFLSFMTALLFIMGVFYIRLEWGF